MPVGGFIFFQSSLWRHADTMNKNWLKCAPRAFHLFGWLQCNANHPFGLSSRAYWAYCRENGNDRNHWIVGSLTEWSSCLFGFMFIVASVSGHFECASTLNYGVTLKGRVYLSVSAVHEHSFIVRRILTAWPIR